VVLLIFRPIVYWVRISISKATGGINPSDGNGEPRLPSVLSEKRTSSISGCFYMLQLKVKNLPVYPGPLRQSVIYLRFQYVVQNIVISSHSGLIG
jgi:hypothetical protein